MPWPVWRSVRAALSIAGPILVGGLLDNAVDGMWIGIGALLLAASERPTGYAARFRQLLVTAPIAASAYSWVRSRTRRHRSPWG
ncbi:MAG: hypothetical protein SFX73_13995 [Kofleriaceae bacterium]|nr:hypothetical protein [Kofleriaceae bacterium]